jgi:hypothetical protein
MPKLGGNNVQTTFVVHPTLPVTTNRLTVLWCTVTQYYCYVRSAATVPVLYIRNGRRDLRRTCTAAVQYEGQSRLKGSKNTADPKFLRLSPHSLKIATETASTEKQRQRRKFKKVHSQQQLCSPLISIYPLVLPSFSASRLLAPSSLPTPATRSHKTSILLTENYLR